MRREPAFSARDRSSVRGRSRTEIRPAAPAASPSAARANSWSRAVPERRSCALAIAYESRCWTRMENPFSEPSTMTSSATTPEFALYGYFRSSAAFRVRIALNLKGIAAEPKSVHLLRSGGEQHGSDYKTLNPQELVPTLLHDGHAIGQSLAIIEYLDEIKPEPPLLPLEPLARARVRQIAYAVACDIHPLNNLRVLL